MKITISYIPDEAPLVSPILESMRRLMPDAKVRSSIAHPPRKVLYLTCNRPGGAKNGV